MSEKCVAKLIINLFRAGEEVEMLGSHQSEALGGLQRIPSETKRVFQTHQLLGFCINQGFSCKSSLGGNGHCLLTNTGHTTNVYLLKRNVMIVDKHCGFIQDPYISLVNIFFNSNLIFVGTLNNVKCMLTPRNKADLHKGNGHLILLNKQ